MRAFTRNALLAVAVLGLTAADLHAQSVMAVIAENPCGTRTNLLTNNAEIYVVKHQPLAASTTDWQVWVGSRALFRGMSAGSANEGGFSAFDTNFANATGPTDVACAFITYPDEQLLVTSAMFDGTSNVLRQRLAQRLGDTLPTGTLSGAGLTLSHGAGTFDVDLGEGVLQSFPQGPQLVFGAIVQQNDSDVGGCSLGGRAGQNSALTGGGCIIGYNVYRIDGDASFMGGDGDLIRTALADQANWVYYLPYTLMSSGMANGGFDLGAGDGGAQGSDAPADSEPAADLAGLQNASAGEDGDEILIFQDSNFGREFIDADMDTVRDPGTSGRPGGIEGQDGAACPNGCWYAIQAVVDGSPGLFGAIGIDADMDGTADSVDFDADGTPEFVSPQADFMIPGLGLTYGGVPHLSKVVFSNAMPLAVRGGVELAASLVGGEVRIALSAPLEDANVLGYNVYRIIGEERARVNDQIIAARGGDGNVYSLQDEVIRTSRRVRQGTAQYEVEVVFNDGSDNQVIGPFDVTSSSDQRSRRR